MNKAENKDKQILEEIIQYCNQSGVNHFYVLLEVAVHANEEWLNWLMESANHSYVVAEYLKSRNEHLSR